MVAEWKETRLGSVIDIKHGFAFSGENIHDEPRGDILLTPGNFAIGGGFKADKFKYFDGDVPNEYVLDEGDLLVTMTDLSKQGDTLGYPAFVPKPSGPRYLHNQRLGKVLIKSDAELDKRYLFYLLRTREYRHEVLASATGTTVKHTSPSRILAHKAFVPSLAEQKAIAAVLGALDDKIELNRRMNATLEATARVLFRSWFVDFDPVRAKLDGRQPAGLDPTTTSLFSNEFEDSELGPIPRGSRVGKVEDILTFNRSTVDPSQFRDELFAHYSLPAFDEGRVPKLELGNAIKSQKLLVSSEAVLLSKLNPHIPRIWLPDVSADNRALCSTEFLVAQPRTGASREFFFCLFTSDAFASDYGTLVTGTTGSHQRVRGESVLQMKVVIPPAPVIDQFSALAKPMFDKVILNIRESTTLAGIRDTLLPKLLSGELKATAAATLRSPSSRAQ